MTMQNRIEMLNIIAERMDINRGADAELMFKEDLEILEELVNDSHFERDLQKQLDDIIYNLDKLGYISSSINFSVDNVVSVILHDITKFNLSQRV